MLDANDIRNIESEAGIVASVLLKPELTFYSENLSPSHFVEPTNAYLYYAVSELAKRKVEKIDAYSITNLLGQKRTTSEYLKLLTIPLINDTIENAGYIARERVEDYSLLVDNVLNAAFRRETFNKLKQCERLCFDGGEGSIEQKIYSTLDDVMVQFSTTQEVPQYKDVVDDLWGEIVERQNGGIAGIPFKFPTLNEYATIEPGELFIFGAEAKQGKSMMLLNCAVDLLRRNLSVLYIDSELNSRLFTCRLIAHLTGIEFSRVKSGRYTDEEGERIKEAIEWLKTRNFTHKYIPMFDAQTIYTTVKKIKHTCGLDVLVIDYFKSKSDGDAFNTYQEMGKLVDMIKNSIAGDMGIAAIGAAQATAAGKLADSAKIGRNASTIAIILDKTPEEIAQDGPECGNKKLQVVLNRNGAQMVGGEYIDLLFDGNHVLYTEAKQHVPVDPY